MRARSIPTFKLPRGTTITIEFWVSVNATREAAGDRSYQFVTPTRIIHTAVNPIVLYAMKAKSVSYFWASSQGTRVNKGKKGFVWDGNCLNCDFCDSVI